ncbi:acyltransferase domain-containing protein [Streptomyces sp. DSM 41534]
MGPGPPPAHPPLGLEEVLEAVRAVPGVGLRFVAIGASGGALHRDVGRRGVEVEAGGDGGLPAGASDGRPGSGLVVLGGCLLSFCGLFDHRAVSLGVGGLRVLAVGGVGDDVVIGRVAVVVGRMVFVFPGRGSRWVGMACELVGGSLVFAARVDECGQVLELFTDWRLADVLGDVDVLGCTEVVQPVLWAVVVWLAAVWQSLGVVPDVVLGHCQGGVAAAVVAGALLLGEGVCGGSACQDVGCPGRVRWRDVAGAVGPGCPGTDRAGAFGRHGRRSLVGCRRRRPRGTGGAGGAGRGAGCPCSPAARFLCSGRVHRSGRRPCGWVWCLMPSGGKRQASAGHGRWPAGQVRGPDARCADTSG